MRGKLRLHNNSTVYSVQLYIIDFCSQTTSLVTTPHSVVGANMTLVET